MCERENLVCANWKVAFWGFIFTMLSIVIFLYVGMSCYVLVDKTWLCEDIVAGPHFKVT